MVMWLVPDLLDDFDKLIAFLLVLICEFLHELARMIYRRDIICYQLPFHADIIFWEVVNAVRCFLIKFALTYPSFEVQKLF